MAESIRYLLDENVDPNVALALRHHGIDAITILEAGLRTCNDDDLLSFALREQRVIVTHDTDFLKLPTQSHDHPGFAYSPPSRATLKPAAFSDQLDKCRGFRRVHDIRTPADSHPATSLYLV